METRLYNGWSTCVNIISSNNGDNDGDYGNDIKNVLLHMII